MKNQERSSEPLFLNRFFDRPKTRFDVNHFGIVNIQINSDTTKLGNTPTIRTNRTIQTRFEPNDLLILTKFVNNCNKTGTNLSNKSENFHNNLGNGTSFHNPFKKHYKNLVTNCKVRCNCANVSSRTAASIANAHLYENDSISIDENHTLLSSLDHPKTQSFNFPCNDVYQNVLILTSSHKLSKKIESLNGCVQSNVLLESDPIAITKTGLDAYFLDDNFNKENAITNQRTCFDFGITWIDTADAKQYFSIEPNKPLNQIAKDKGLFDKFLKYCIGANGLIKNYEDDLDSIKVNHCFNLHFSQYIGQNFNNKFGINPVEFVLNKIERFRKLILKANAGTGKSFLTQLLAHQGKRLVNKLTVPNLKRLKKMGVKHIIFLTPTTSITNQQHKDFISNNGLNASCIDGQSSKEDVLSAKQSGVIVATFDSLYKFAELIKDSLLIIDEYHQLVNDFSYRNKKAFRFVFDSIRDAKRVLMYSATANLALTKHLEETENFGFKLINGIESITNEIQLTGIEYKGKQNDIFTYIEENIEKGKGTITVKLDSKAKLGANMELQKRRGIAVDALWSEAENDNRKTNNDNYNSIVDSGALSAPLDWLYYTTLLEAGVSLKFPVRLNCLLDTKHHDRLVQLSTRARYNHTTGLNKVHKVWIFKTDQGIKNNYSQPVKPYIDRFKDLYKRAVNLCNDANEIQHGELRHKTQSDDIESLDLFYKNDDGIHVPCVLSCLAVLYKQSESAPLELMLKRVQRMDSRFVIMPTIKAKIEVNERLAEIVASQKIANEIKLRGLNDLAKNEFNLLAQTVCYLSKDPKLKEKLRDRLRLPEISKDLIIDFAADKPGLFNGNTANRIVKSVAFFVENGALKVSSEGEKLTSKIQKIAVLDAVELVVNEDNKTIKSLISSTNRELRNKVIRYKINDSNAKDKFCFVREQAIIKTFKQYRKECKLGRTKDFQPKEFYQKKINRAVKKLNTHSGNKFKLVSTSKSIATIKDIFLVQEKRVKKGKKSTRLYKVGAQKVSNSIAKNDPK